MLLKSWVIFIAKSSGLGVLSATMMNSDYRIVRATDTYPQFPLISHNPRAVSIDTFVAIRGFLPNIGGQDDH